MAKFEYSIRCMRIEDVVEAADLWYETGMLISLQSVYSWLQVDPEGFYVAVTEAGEIIGVCAAVNHHEDMSMIGMYVVKKEYRGKGIGFKLWSTAMEHVGQRNACMYSVRDLREKYQKKGGFPIPETDWVLLVYIAKAPVNPGALSDSLQDGMTVQPFEERHLPLIYELDKTLVGYERQLALELNCKEKESYTFVAVKDNICYGFGTIKTFGPTSVIVGPLYAENAVVAEVILKKLILCFPEDKRFSMMTFSDNVIATDLMKRINCDLKSESYHLYKKEKITFNHDKLFAMFHCHFSPI